jgi:hypothetical protein
VASRIVAELRTEGFRAEPINIWCGLPFGLAESGTNCARGTVSVAVYEWVLARGWAQYELTNSEATYQSAHA